MTRMPQVTSRELVSFLMSQGFVQDRQSWSHLTLWHEQRHISTTVPVHTGSGIGRGLAAPPQAPAMRRSGPVKTESWRNLPYLGQVSCIIRQVSHRGKNKRDIRSSEKRFYQEIRDVFKLVVGYGPRTDETLEFFNIVQNRHIEIFC